MTIPKRKHLKNDNSGKEKLEIYILEQEKSTEGQFWKEKIWKRTMLIRNNSEKVQFRTEKNQKNDNFEKEKSATNDSSGKEQSEKGQV